MDMFLYQGSGKLSKLGSRPSMAVVLWALVGKNEEVCLPLVTLEMERQEECRDLVGRE